ncbi:hypothetical protein [Cellulosimicrobium sp. SL-1]|uniref:hypothetical protein n=1 Tax=Cellulosimicrobium sp. SL-1 TaxID=2699423 RepID=UPI0013CFDB2D|nr:hypothetical protein [Cellulosimicrobium sp. SL-1]
MATTITATPRVGSASVDLRVTRDDSSGTNIAAEWARGDEASNLAQKATWSDPSKFVVTAVDTYVQGSASKTFTAATPGQRVLFELWATGTTGGWKINGAVMKQTRETGPYDTRRFVWEGVVPSGGLVLLFDMLPGYSSGLYSYKITRLLDQRVMTGPEFASGDENAWMLLEAPPFWNEVMQWASASTGLYATWYNTDVTGTIAAKALAAQRTINTTAGRTYTVTTEVSVFALKSTTGLFVEILTGTTVLAAQEVVSNAPTVVRLSFVAPGTSVTMRVSNRQPFVVEGPSSYNARYYVRTLLVERMQTDDLSAADYTITTLSRTDSNGVRQVRLVRGADLVNGALDATDYEPALQGLVAYTVVSERVGAAGSREIVTTSTRLDTAGNVFIDAATPQLRFNAELVETYTATNATSAVFHDVIGRADPVVSEGVQRLRDGSMRVWFPSYEAAKDAIAAFGRGRSMLWRSTDNAGLDMYFRSVNVSSAPYDTQTTPRRWYVDVTFREVATPTSPLEGDAAWNFAASAERNETFFDSFTEFSVFADLLNGPEEV